jgi:hypothetical protein
VKYNDTPKCADGVLALVWKWVLKSILPARVMSQGKVHDCSTSQIQPSSKYE